MTPQAGHICVWQTKPSAEEGFDSLWSCLKTPPEERQEASIQRTGDGQQQTDGGCYRLVVFETAIIASSRHTEQKIEVKRKVVEMTAVLTIMASG